jgi:hypothetical protein
MPIVETKVLVREATADIVALFATPRLEYLPAVIPQPVAAPPVEEVQGDPLDAMPADETHVPDFAQQRLIYHWLLNGPAWARSIVVEAPPPPPDEPVVVPFRDHRSDGVRRMIVCRE